MDTVLNFRSKLNECNSILKKIATLKCAEVQKSEDSRNNNTFFNAFIEYVKLMNSYSVIRRFESFNLSIQDLDDIKKVTVLISDSFKKKEAKNPTQIQVKVKKINEHLQKLWLTYSTEMTSDIIERLEIYWLVCNNRKQIRDIINSLKCIQEWPLTDDYYKKYNSNYDIANEMINSTHFDDEIELFLKKVKDRTATLLDLNDKILQWIKENNLNGNIMLAIKM